MFPYEDLSLRLFGTDNVTSPFHHPSILSVFSPPPSLSLSPTSSIPQTPLSVHPSNTLSCPCPPTPLLSAYPANGSWDKLKRPAQFLSIPRSSLILHAFGTFLMLLSAFIVTISAWTAKGCKNADDDPHASLGDTYKDDLKQWCDTKKASAIFDWYVSRPISIASC